MSSNTQYYYFDHTRSEYAPIKEYYFSEKTLEEEPLVTQLRIGNRDEIKILNTVNEKTYAGKKPEKFLTPLYIDVMSKLSYTLREATKNNNDITVTNILSGADFNEISPNEKKEILGTCFEIAFRKKHFEILETIVGNASYKKVVAKNLIWALPEAAKNGNLEIVKIFCEKQLPKELDLYSWKHIQKDAYFSAAEKGHDKVIIELMQNDSEMIETADLREIFERARKNGHDHVEKELRKTFEAEHKLLFMAVDVQIAIKRLCCCY